MPDLSRLLRPASIAAIGGGAWCANVIQQCRKIGFAGAIWYVHPTRGDYASLSALPHAPDASFIGVNAQATVAVVRELAMMGAGGAVCFASGFAEASAEIAGAADLQAELLAAARGMPILGPNCYGFINALNGAALWPDQHGCARVERGVAILTQSSNIAINLTMQTRALPISYVVTVGNQAQLGMAEIGCALLDDPRVTALGLHIEGFGNPRAFEALAAKAREQGKAIVAVKVGASTQAQAATISHTASLAGSDAGARALCARLGIGQAASLTQMLEALKILHTTGPLPSNQIASMSCSGGEASLMADTGLRAGVEFPPLNQTQTAALRAALGAKVALANPLDYHTYIWGDVAAMTACFTAMMAPHIALGCVVLDFPRVGICDDSEWRKVVTAMKAAAKVSGRPMALVSSLPENLPEDVAADCIASGIVPLCGLDDALAAVAICAGLCAADTEAPLAAGLAAGALGATHTLSEAEGKAELAAYGLPVPRSLRAANPAEAARQAATLTFPVVLKGEGIAHKTEAGAVALNLGSAEAVRAAAERMPATSFLVEEMITGAVAEMLIGVVRDPAHGFVLTIGAGGVWTEILRDTQSLLLPVRAQGIAEALGRLRIAPLLAGYRGAPAAASAAIIDAVLALQAYVIAHADDVAEAEINPLICTPTRAIAADALIRKAMP